MLHVLVWNCFMGNVHYAKRPYAKRLHPKWATLFWNIKLFFQVALFNGRNTQDIATEPNRMLCRIGDVAKGSVVTVLLCHFHKIYDKLYKIYICFPPTSVPVKFLALAIAHAYNLVDNVTGWTWIWIWAKLHVQPQKTVLIVLFPSKWKSFPNPLLPRRNNFFPMALGASTVDVLLWK